MTAAARQVREQSMRELEIALNDFGRNEPARVVDLVVKKTSLLGLRKVVRRTPVMTGITRGGWFVSIGSPQTGDTSVADKSGAAAISAGSAVIQGTLPKFPVVWIQNNKPWILVLEDGGYPPNPKKGTYIPSRTTRSGRRTKAKYEIRSSGGFSRQAPQGMVAVTIEELRQQFTEARG